MISRKLRSYLMPAGVIACLSGTADAQELHELLVEAWETPVSISLPGAEGSSATASAGMDVTYSGAISRGDTVEFTDLVFTLETSVNGSNPLAKVRQAHEFASVRLENIAVADDGGIGIGRLFAEDYRSYQTAGRNDDIVFTSTEFECSNSYIPDRKNLGTIQQYIAMFSFMSGEACSVGPGVFLIKDDPVATIDRIAFGQSSLRDLSLIEGKVVVEGGTLTLSGLPSTKETDEARLFLSALGYDDELEFDGSSRLSWDLESGELTLDSLNLRVKDMGEIYLGIGINGISESFINNLFSSSSLESAGMKVLNLSFAGFEIGGDDTELASRLIDFGEMAGEQSRADIITQITQVIRRRVEPQVGNEFADILVDAVTRYINDPQNFNISAFPPSPVNFAQIGITGATAPSWLPALLNVQIAVNEE